MNKSHIHKYNDKASPAKGQVTPGPHKNLSVIGVVLVP